jgi:hypothetical protein
MQEILPIRARNAISFSLDRLIPLETAFRKLPQELSGIDSYARQKDRETGDGKRQQQQPEPQQQDSHASNTALASSHPRT